MANERGVYRARTISEYIRDGVYNNEDKEVLDILRVHKATTISVTDIARKFLKRVNLGDNMSLGTARSMVFESLNRLEKEGKAVKTDRGRWKYV